MKKAGFWAGVIAAAELWLTFGSIYITIFALALSPWFWLLFLLHIPVGWLLRWAWSKWSMYI